MGMLGAPFRVSVTTFPLSLLHRLAKHMELVHRVGEHQASCRGR
jgi:hypothetical protein